MTYSEFGTLLYSEGAIPVAVIERKADAAETARSLLAGGLHTIEITLRTAAAQDAVAAVRTSCPGITVGAGTVRDLYACREAYACGAQFIVSPGFDEDIVRFCKDHDLPCLPGCVTPTELMRAEKAGLRLVKFFPASVYGGIPALRALHAPFPEIGFIPTGGVTEADHASWLSLSFVPAVGGSWLCESGLIREHRFEEITRRAAKAVACRKEVRA